MATPTAYQLYRDARFFGSLDGLRCLCIVMVLWHHSPIFASLEDHPRILGRGFAGVDFFFVLSGFLITTLLLREHAKTGAISLRGFYWRRILRIVPVYFLVVSVMAFYWIGVKGQTEYLRTLPYYYGFLSNYLQFDMPLLTPTWSLAVEEQYYLLWPLMLVLLPGRVAWRLGLAGVLVIVLALVGLGILPAITLAPPTDISSFNLPALSFLALLLGSLLAIFLHTHRGFEALFAIVGHRGATPVLLVGLGMVFHFTPGHFYSWPSILAYLFMAAIIASLVVREDGMLAPVLKWGPIARVGAISYGLYLWHTPVRELVVILLEPIGISRTENALLVSVVFVAASIAMAEVSFRYFESWFLRLKDRRSQPDLVADRRG